MCTEHKAHDWFQNLVILST